MCLADYLLGEATDVGSSVITVEYTKQVQLCSANPRRTLLVFATSGTTNVYVSNEYNVSVETGIGLRVYQDVLVLPIATYGQLVRKAWWGLADSQNEKVTVYEGFLDIDCYRRLMRQYNQG